MELEHENQAEGALPPKSSLTASADFVLRHTVAVLVVIFGLGAALVLWNQMRLANQLVETTTVTEAARYSQALATFRTLYTRHVVETVRAQNIEVTHDFDSEEKRGKAIPLPATLSMLLGNELTRRRHHRQQQQQQRQHVC